MFTRIYWISTNCEELTIGVMARPRGGDWLESEIRNLKNQGVATLVSFLTSSEEDELELTEERKISLSNSVNFFSFPINDSAA